MTSSLGFHPDRHAGKIVGLAAYGDPRRALGRAARRASSAQPGDFRIVENLNVHFSRHLAARFPKIDVAAAYQHVLEVVAADLVRHWVRETGCGNVVLSGGVTANVKMNQRIHEIDEVERTFVYPNMGDGGCGTGLALHAVVAGRRAASRSATCTCGPEFTPTRRSGASSSAHGLALRAAGRSRRARSRGASTPAR